MVECRIYCIVTSRTFAHTEHYLAAKNKCISSFANKSMHCYERIWFLLQPEKSIYSACAEWLNHLIGYLLKAAGFMQIFARISTNAMGQTKRNWLGYLFDCEMERWVDDRNFYQLVHTIIGHLSFRQQEAWWHPF